MNDEEDRLIRIAEAVSDGRAVDWEAEISASPRLKRRMQKLRVLQSIAAFHETPAEATPASEMDSARDLSRASTIDPPHRRQHAIPPPPAAWGHLQIIEKLDEGAHGEVFRALDPKLGTEVALKLLRTDVRIDPRRFLSEARRLARVRHKNVLTVHGAAEHDGRVGHWTEFVTGETLEQRLQREGRFGPEEAMAIGITLCEALAAVHAQGLVHRDVKTSNIMREEGGRIVLMDFSAAIEGRDEAGRPVHNPLSGTPLFMAPEVIEGREADKSSDIYSLGVVLYRLISGRFPVDARNLRELKQSFRDGGAPSLLDARPEVSPALARVVDRALARDPASRFRSAGEMQRELATACGRHEAEPPRPTRRWMLFAAAFVAVAAGLLLGWAYLGLPTGPLQVDASFFRVPAGDPLREERLLPGARILAGDQLYLEVRGTDPYHLYVMNEDSAGRVVLMFPLPSLDQANPLEPGVTYRLPGSVSGTPKLWDLGGDAGRETFVVIASRTRLEDLEARLEEVRLADAGSGVEVDPDLAAQTVRGVLRGITGISDAPDAGLTPAGRRLLALTRGLHGQATAGTGVWMWTIELQNAGRP